MFKKITPVLIVEAIEPVLSFWAAAGLQPVTQVPHGDRIGFVILQGDGVELMYQTIDSVREDEKRVLEGPAAIGAGALFSEVADIEALSSRLPGDTDVVVKRRTTFYGSTETIVRDPAGNVIVFAQMTG